MADQSGQMGMASGMWYRPEQRGKRSETTHGQNLFNHLYRGYILANGDVEISSHLVDVQMSVNPAGASGGGGLLSVGRMKKNKT